MAEVGFILQVGHNQVDEVTFSFSHMPPWRANWLGRRSLSAFSSNVFAECRGKRVFFFFFNVNLRLTFSDTSHPLKILLYIFWDEISIFLIFLSLSTCSVWNWNSNHDILPVKVSLCRIYTSPGKKGKKAAKK